MKVKLDENLPAQLVPVLTELGHDVDTVLSEGIAGRDDAVVWQAAQAGGRFLVTQDLDFSDVRRYTPGTHHGLLLVRLPEPGRTALFERVVALFRMEDVNSWGGCMVTATPHKVRVRHPPSESPDPIPWTR
jgi:predicted nuclease of predicted toxin-antitoxin system